jgi:hypothetical protein
MKTEPDLRTAVHCHCHRKADLSFSSSLVESVRMSTPGAAVTMFDCSLQRIVVDARLRASPPIERPLPDAVPMSGFWR